MKIKWLGHASVLITANSGLRIVTDPFATGYHAPPCGTLTYKEIGEAADIIVVTHEHPDHSNVSSVKGNPDIVRGAELRKSGPMRVRDIEFKVIPCYHDGVGGKLLGENNMVYFEIEGLKICHTGDAGHRLNNEQLKELGKVDVLLLCVGLLVPVGERQFIPNKPGPNNFSWSDYIIDANVANQLYDQMRPRVLIPIHYANEKCSLKLVGVEEFLKGKKNVQKTDTSNIYIDPGKLTGETQIIVLKPEL